jgi:uncharacterized protein
MSKMRVAVAALLLGAFAAPVAAQSGKGFGSDSYRFFKAVREKDGPGASTLMSQPGSTLVNQRDYDSGDYALHIVTRRRDTPWMSLLLARGANVDAKDKAGNTALILAAELGFTDGVQLLLGRKANVNAVNSQGETPLIKAVQVRDTNSARLLLAAGANPDQSDNITGRSAREYAEQDRRAGMIVRLFKDADEKKAAPATAAATPSS